ncbi:MAG: GTP 3',8-cyclase MoaA [Candidatus Binatia bacterium]|nr:GTP 3',8-cyclase MoaA [Candidatus Binatia bacterium]
MITDTLNRPVKDLRVSVTDRCNYRCTYCMPHDEYTWADKKGILSFEEITRLARLFAKLGVEKIRLTGGEPLVRQGVERLIHQLSRIPEIKDLCLTTNGSLLLEKARELKAAGLTRINVSLDSLIPEKFTQITKRGDLGKVLDGLFAAKENGLHPIKINAVIERGVNNDEIIPMVEFCRQNGFSLRFIEYMDVGNTNDWASEKMVSKKEIFEIINDKLPLKEIGRASANDTAVRFQIGDGIDDFSVIASVTEPFCPNCSRARITADGKLVLCLFSSQGQDLKELMRSGASDESITERITSTWKIRKDRYSDERLTALQSSGGYDPKKRKKIEMITLGG